MHCWHCNVGVTSAAARCSTAPLPGQSAASLRLSRQSARSAVRCLLAGPDGWCSPRTVQAAQPVILLAPARGAQGCCRLPTRQIFARMILAPRVRAAGAAHGVAADQLIHADRPVQCCSCSTSSGPQRPAGPRTEAWASN